MDTPQKKRKRDWARSKYHSNTDFARTYARNYRRAWVARNKERHLKYVASRKALLVANGMCFVCAKSKAAIGGLCTQCRENRRLATKKSLAALRVKAIDLYGGRCACCRETEKWFLTFDHVNNDGAAKRKEWRMNGSPFFRYLIRERPSDIQILCWNCNCAKGFYGVCPHQIRVSSKFMDGVQGRMRQPDETVEPLLATMRQ